MDENEQAVMDLTTESAITGGPGVFNFQTVKEVGKIIAPFLLAETIPPLLGLGGEAVAGTRTARAVTSAVDEAEVIVGAPRSGVLRQRFPRMGSIPPFPPRSIAPEITTASRVAGTSSLTKPLIGATTATLGSFILQHSMLPDGETQAIDSNTIIAEPSKPTPMQINAQRQESTFISPFQYGTVHLAGSEARVPIGSLSENEQRRKRKLDAINILF